MIVKIHNSVDDALLHNSKTLVSCEKLRDKLGPIRFTGNKVPGT